MDKYSDEEALRLLCLPAIGFRNANKDSAFLMMANIVKHFSNVYCYWVLPRFCKKYSVELPSPGEIIWEGKTGQDALGTYDVIDKFFDETIVSDFQRRTGKYIFDAVLTSRVGLGIALSKLNDDFRDTDSEKNLVPIFTIDPLADDYYRIKNLRIAMTYATTTPVFLSKWSFTTARRMACKYLSIKEMKKFEDRMIINATGVGVEETLKEIQGISKSKRITLFWGSRITAGKRAGFVFDEYARIFSSGRYRALDVVIANPSNSEMFDTEVQRVLDKWGMNWAQWHKGCDWRKYIRLAARSHVALIGSPDETLGKGFIEQGLIPGLVLILPRKEWAIEVFGQDYPFFYRSDSDARALLHYVIDNYEGCVQKVSYLQKFLSEKFSLQNTVLKLVEHIENAVSASIKGKISYDQLPWLVQGISLKKEFSFGELMVLMEKHSRGGFSGDQQKKFRRRIQYSNWEIHHFVLQQGYIDTCTTTMPYYMKVGN